MHKIITYCGVVLLLTGNIPAVAASNGVSFGDISSTELEKRLDDIDTELEQLANYSLRTGIGAVGYRSDAYESPENTEWVQIELGNEYAIDQIILVPSIWRDTKSSFLADGFPVEFKILSGNRAATNETLLASFEAEDNVLPRIAPLVVPCAVTASWVRVQASVLSPRAFDGKFNLEFSEIMVFSGQENVSLRKPVHISSKGDAEAGARRREFLVDGFVPYLMDAGQGTQSIAAVGEPEEDTTASLTIDLGAPCQVSRIHLHSVDLSDTVPQTTPVDFGLPRLLVVAGANKADLSDAVPLASYRINSVFDAGPIIMLSFPEKVCRYIQIHIPEPYIYTLDDEQPGARIGFAEIELFSSAGHPGNLALYKPVEASFGLMDPNRSLSALTDGRNLYGSILPVRDWLNQLARRHVLEVKRPLVAAELGRRYARQKIYLRVLTYFALLLAAGIGFTMMFDRMLRMRHVARIRERFAADLHDELGANLHTIGLLSDLAEGAKDSPEELSQLHQRIRAVTERTGMAVRHCTDMLEVNGLFTDLLSDMRRAAERIMATYDHQFFIVGEEHLARLNQQTGADLFLFYKEGLVNIVRHSDATHFSTHVSANPKNLTLSIQDNGRSFLEEVPPSLKRRARLIGAKVIAEAPEGGGTCIRLSLKISKKNSKS